MLKKGSIITVLAATTIVVLFTFCDKRNDPAPSSASAENETAATPATTFDPLESESLSTTSGPSTGPSTSPVTPTLDPLSSESTMATQNSTLYVSTTLPEWSFDPCLLNPLTLQGTNGGTVVLLTFGSVIATGNYTLTSGVPLPGEVRMTVLNPPGQPTGILWVSKNGGTVSVNVGTSTTIAAFTGVQCTQPLFPYPIVTVSGDVGCN